MVVLPSSGPWLSSSFYRPRRGSARRWLPREGSLGDGKIECFTLVKSHVSVSIWVVWSSCVLYGGRHGQRGAQASLLSPQATSTPVLRSLGLSTTHLDGALQAACALRPSPNKS
jgi:hypothetical protein